MERQLAIGRSALTAIPLFTHQTGLPEQPVHLLHVAPTPKSEDGCQGEIRFAVRPISREVAREEQVEFRTLLSRASLTDDRFIREIRVSFHRLFLLLGRTEHVLIEKFDQRVTDVRKRQ